MFYAEKNSSALKINRIDIFLEGENKKYFTSQSIHSNYIQYNNDIWYIYHILQKNILLNKIIRLEGIYEK